jgi:hypothetical protein
MNLLTYFPAWMVFYFGISGTIGLILVAMVFWTWRETTRLTRRYARAALVWNMVGYVFLFSASWFACGIGGGPGNLLSTDPAMRQPMLATGAAIIAMAVSLPGWGCILMSQRTILTGLKLERKVAPPVSIKTAPLVSGDSGESDPDFPVVGTRGSSYHLWSKTIIDQQARSN